MPGTMIKGNRRLAKALGVHYTTVQKWKSSGRLNKAILIQWGRVIIYDLEKVFECLNGQGDLLKEGKNGKQ